MVSPWQSARYTRRGRFLASRTLSIAFLTILFCTLKILLTPYPDHLVGNYLDGRLGEFSRIQPAQKSALVYTYGLSNLESGEGFDNAYYRRC
jgi:hypothetical protein